jgi:hypothetical protein
MDGGCQRLLFFIGWENGVGIDFFYGIVIRSPFLSLRHRLTVFFASQIAHSMQNRMGKTGMAVANASYFLLDGKTASVSNFLIELLKCPVSDNVSITSPSDGHFCLTDSSFYAESNGEDRDGGCQRLLFYCM